MTEAQGELSSERTDFLATLATQRAFMRRTVNGLSDEQAASRPTASELCLGGIVKHVSLVEQGWVNFILHGPDAMDSMNATAHAQGFRMLEGETLADLLQFFADVADTTTEVVRSIPSLDDSHLLPDSPWFEKGARWTARRVLLHIIAETAQHCGHADIIRETIDGQKTMG